MKPRDHPAWFAWLAHRLSGIALALFLPLHFLMLGTALRGEEALDRALALTDNPLVKLAEWGLVLLLSLHLGLGLRVLAIEFLPWRGVRRCCSRPVAAPPCTSTTRRRATRAATAWRWRCASASPCGTWRWCSSTRRDCWPDPRPA